MAATATVHVPQKMVLFQSCAVLSYISDVPIIPCLTLDLSSSEGNADAAATKTTGIVFQIPASPLHSAGAQTVTPPWGGAAVLDVNTSLGLACLHTYQNLLTYHHPPHPAAGSRRGRVLVHIMSHVKISPAGSARSRTIRQYWRPWSFMFGNTVTVSADRMEAVRVARSIPYAGERGGDRER